MSDDEAGDGFQDLFDEAPCGYIVTRPDGTLLRVNQTFLRWTGYRREELLSGKRFQDLLTTPGKLFYENQYFPLLRMQGFAREIAFDLVSTERERLPVLVDSVQKSRDDGQPVAIATTLFMATDRRAYEHELLEARRGAEQLSAIVTMSPDAITRCSASGVIETWNEGARRMFGFTETEVRDMHLQQLLPSFGDGEWARIATALQSGEAVHREAIGRRVDGISIDVSVGLAPHRGPLGDIAGVSAIIRDISESKAIQRLQNEFLAMTSHELRTPLTAIRGHAQLMLRRGTYDQSHLETIVGAANQLGRLIEDLLLASRLEADGFALREAAIDVRVPVQAAVDQVAGVSDRGITIDLPAEPLPIWGDPLRLGQILANLLSNAVKYSHEGTDIVVQVTRTPSEVRVHVIDHGVGIPAEEIPHLFDRFYRAAGAAEYAQGAGLGLYIADRLARAHGGRLMVESEVDRGSVFTLCLPLHEEDARQGQSPALVSTRAL